MPTDERRNWTREETMLAFELYCILPPGKVTVNNDAVISLARSINRTPGSIKLKLQNFKAYDPSYTNDGRVGLNHGSKLDENVCQEFLHNWDALVLETNDIKTRLNISKSTESENPDNEQIIELPKGYDAKKLRRERVGQAFFRNALMSAYNGRCCFTGIAIPELLRASHIKPWSESNNENEKTNPMNGLLLNALHDAAFDKGFITITVDYIIQVSPQLLSDDVASRKYFEPLHGKRMTLPNRFLPAKQFVEYHNSIFRIQSM